MCSLFRLTITRYVHVNGMLWTPDKTTEPDVPVFIQLYDDRVSSFKSILHMKISSTGLA